MALRRRLHAEGYRFRVDFRPLQALRRKADIVFTKQRVAVFVDGCFWHHCPDHGTMPVSNRAWWEDKLARNVTRDAETDRILAEAGWSVLRVWEHQSTDEAVAKFMEIVASQGLPRGGPGIKQLPC